MTTPDRLRIALLVHEYNRYMGHSRYTAELATRFRRDHDVHVFTNAVDDPDRAGITFHHVPMWRANALTNIVSFLLPATALLRGRFDVVHAQGLCGLRQNVVTAHICQPAWYAAGDRYAPEAGWRKRVFRSVVLGLDRLVMRRGAAARFIAPSGRVKADLATHYKLGDAVRVVHHGTDTDAFHPRNRDRFRGPVRAELGVPADACVALYVGDLRKGMPAAVRAAARVPGVTLVAVTRSDPAPERALATELGIADRVIFVPPSKDIARYYAAADLFVFPTYYDTFGLVLTEAMASGLPAVVSPAAGASELVNHGVTGWVTTDPWDAGQIAEGLRYLAADPTRRSAMGAAARTAVEAHTWDRTAVETMAVYREVIAARGKRA